MSGASIPPAADLSGKVAIVTGAARGIGRAIALRLARHGADVMVADIDLDGARAFGEVLDAASVEGEIVAIGRRSAAFEGDLADEVRARALVDRTLGALGRADILVNCAGGATIPRDRSRASITTADEMRRVFAANYDSMAHCSSAIVPHLRERRSGSIVNIASVSGFVPQPEGYLAHYGAAKAAMMSFTRSLAVELMDEAIRVNAIAPGTILTPRIAATYGVGTASASASQPMPAWVGQSDDVAKVALFFASDLSGFVTGQSLAVAGGSPSLAC